MLRFEHFPEEYRWHNKTWVKRKQVQRFPTIGRLYNVSIHSGERFWLKMLLRQSRQDIVDTAISFDAMMGSCHSYHERCLELGLVDNTDGNSSIQLLIKKNIFVRVGKNVKTLFVSSK